MKAELTRDEQCYYEKVTKMIELMKRHGWKSCVFHSITPSIKAKLEQDGYEVSESMKFVSWLKPIKATNDNQQSICGVTNDHRNEV